MSDLVTYVREHSDRNACTCGKYVVSGPDHPMVGHTVDMFFFDVCAKNEPNADTLRKLIAEHKGEFNEVNPFDGQEHGYTSVSSWKAAKELLKQRHNAVKVTESTDMFKVFVEDQDANRQ